MYNYGYPFQQQPMTDIGQVSGEQEAVNAYVAAGRSKIMFTQDDRTVFVKSVSMNGQDLEHIDKMAHALKCLATYEAMKASESGRSRRPSGRYYEPEYRRY